MSRECIIDWMLPIKLVSPNVKEHWSKGHARSRAQRTCLKIRWMKHNIKDISLPCIVKITRYAPRLFDLDNFIASTKSLADNIGALIRPEKARGHADGDGMIKFEYDQVKNKENIVRIQIYSYEAEKKCNENAKNCS